MQISAHDPQTVSIDWFSRRVFNPLVGWLTRRGLSLMGTRVLTVVGRRSGEPRETVVNLLDLHGERYLVAPRGHTQWSKNLRAAGTGTLRCGRRREDFNAVELADDDKVDVLRAYLARWQWEVGRFVGDLRADSPDDDVRAAAHRFPVFRIALT